MTTPIFFSQSAARRKPPPVERKLECTLEDLCFGCVKKIDITRDAISCSGYEIYIYKWSFSMINKQLNISDDVVIHFNKCAVTFPFVLIDTRRLIVQEEDTLMIKVKPGWKNGTKIVFEGKGDERPGSLPADIIFAVDEKIHPLFERKEDDLEVGVEVPLVQALTGCTISVPLLGGEELEICIDEIIYPGYEKIILGQGMPKNKEEGLMVRGDLRLKFMVEFPEELTDCQRDEVVSILRDQCS
ncbi:PREDICTED: dnaJ homolog subfamily B member 13-like [Erythranthe guttata]|uniref:dnaJ homolog subfamily B member 13-like n=1 Tax=Erythranthe guttata TaxID=4155 RepID=UPI00064DA5F1|nr:PREDICTED: dnaJ homolog subfamily B member 13-like [Erythranthe guttata]|eukprot:XP_012839762.1 PREDICTED: dnaJ homolog subfamily B member 13-like [Erythranthe guttata]